MCSEELMVVPCGARIGGYCDWPSVWGLHQVSPHAVRAIMAPLHVWFHST